MAHKTRADCPIATAIFIRKQAERLGVPLEKMIEDYAVEADTPKETVRHWVWPRKRTVKNDSTPKVKKLDDVAGVIKKGEVADEDVKKNEEPDAPDEFRQLFKNILFVNEKLQMWSDGEMEPNSKDGATVKRILAALPFLCLQAARLGLDLQKIHKEFCRRESYLKKFEA